MTKFKVNKIKGYRFSLPIILLLFLQNIIKQRSFQKLDESKKIRVNFKNFNSVEFKDVLHLTLLWKSASYLGIIFIFYNNSR